MPAYHRKILILMILLILVSCNTLASPTRISIPGLTNTLAVQTMAADPLLVHLVYTPTPMRYISLDPQSDQMTTSVLTPTPTRISSQYVSDTYPGYNLPVATLTPIPTKETCTNAAEFVKDLSFPDDSWVKPGQTFTKIWQLKNIGTCTWTESYSAIQVWGEPMDATSPFSFLETVKPGDDLNLAVEMTAPLMPDCYQSNWMLQDPSGNQFGTGSESQNSFWVAVSVVIPGLGDFIVGHG